MLKLFDVRLGLRASTIGIILAVALGARPDTQAQHQPSTQVQLSLATFVYPGSTLHQPPAKGGSATFARKYSTTDAFEKVVRWYLAEFFAEHGNPRSEGVKRSISSQDTTATVGDSIRLDGYLYLAEPVIENRTYDHLEVVVHDYLFGSVDKHVQDEPLLWTLTAKISEGERRHIINVVVTRTQEKQLTHIALSWLPG
jgi:hypothetical protein